MQFLYPTFLFALAALAIPIILHLFYFRRFKKVYFTNVRFLKEVKEETSARSKLRNLLVLLMRLLAIAFLVLAFAQPFIPAKDAEVKAGNKAVSIFIDNSFSMEALSQDVPLLEKAKQRAREAVQAYAPDDQFQILTNDFEGRHQRLVGRDDALALIDEAAISPEVKALSRVLTRQQQALNTGRTDNHAAYLISDFQRNITDIESYADTTLELNLIPLQAVQERNIGIDSAWFDAPVPMANQTNAVIVKVRNFTGEDAENIRLSIRYDGQTKPVGTLSIPANASVLDTVNLSIQRTGWHEAELAITDYPVQFDDTYYFSFNVREQINVLAINEAQPGRYLTAAFAGMANFNLDNLLSQNLDYSSFANYQLIIVNSLNDISTGLAFELSQFVKEGGNLLVFPGRNANLESYRSFLSSFPADELLPFEEQARIVGQVNTEEFIFNDVFENKSANLKLPATQGNFRLSSSASRGEERLLTYRDGNAFLSKYQVEKGNLYLCAAPLDEEYNGLVRNGEIFIPMLYKMAISAGKGQKVAYTIGRDEVIEASHQTASSDIVYKLKGQGREFIPEQRIIGSKVFLSVNNQVRDAGFYTLFLQEGNPLGTYAFNYDRRESALDYYAPDALRELIGEQANIINIADTAVLTARIEEQSQGTPLWRWCLILALVFLAAEVLLLRLWKV
ncbi:MAG: BatA domain-containing protein [Phaeodactylibacter sp.]|nr:BatA domain-containing protein [Phaeodactylibacter sp.]